MLNNHGESGQPCLVPDLSGNGFSFSPLRMTLAMGHHTFIYNVQHETKIMPRYVKWQINTHTHTHTHKNQTIGTHP